MSLFLSTRAFVNVGLLGENRHKLSLHVSESPVSEYRALFVEHFLKRSYILKKNCKEVVEK